MKRDEEGHRGHVGGLFDWIFLMAAPYDPTHPADHHHSQLHPSPIFIPTLTNPFPHQPLPFPAPLTAALNPAAPTVSSCARLRRMPPRLPRSYVARWDVVVSSGPHVAAPAATADTRATYWLGMTFS